MRENATARPPLVRPGLPALSLRARIFLAMVTGALLVHIGAGLALMNRITEDFDQRVYMASVSAGHLAWSFYSQREAQLAVLARTVAAMPSVRNGVAEHDGVALQLIHDRLQNATQLAEGAEGYLVFDSGGHMLYDGYDPAMPTPLPLTLAAVLGGAASSQGVEMIDGKPTLVAAAPVVGNSGLEGVVGIVEPISGRLLADTQKQIGYPCSVFDGSGHYLAASPGADAYSAGFPVQRLAQLAAQRGDGEQAGEHVAMPDKNADVYLLPLFNPRGDLAATVALYQPTTAVRQLQWNVQLLFLALGAVAFLVSATIAWVFSRMIVRPIRRLAVAADEIAGGQYDHPIPLRGQVEIGQLTAAFERMRKRIRETTRALVDEKRHSEAEAALLNAVLNATNDGMIVLDAGGRFRLANRRWESMFGIEGEALAGLGAEELRRCLAEVMAEPEAFDRRSEALLLDPERTVYDEEFAQRSPEPRRLRRFSAPVRAQNGEIVGRVFVYTDITRERQADELKQALLSTVSHELRTPLTTIKGYARTLLLEDWDPETQRDFLHIVDEEADKLSELVDNLLDLSKLEAGVLQIHRQPVALCPLIRRVVQRRRETDVSHRFSADCAEHLPLVEGDPRRLEQVLENLVENGRKYSAGGTIRLAARQRGDEVEVTVSDQGQGIPEELLERVFERFYRVDNRLSRETGGTGLGLSISRRLVEAHGGRIWVQRSSPEGTTIAFTLPVLTPPGEPAAPPRALPPAVAI